MKTRLSKFALVFVAVTVLFFAATAQANPYRVTDATDFWFTFEEPSVLVAYTTNVDGGWTDPMLWLYDEQGTLLAANDDYQGLMSRVEVQVVPGVYRLRAGVCCGDPNRWWPGWVYGLTTNVGAWANTTTTIEQTLTSEPSTTTSMMSTTSLLESTLPPISSLPISSTTTTTLPDPTTTILITTLPTLTPSTVMSSSTTTTSTLPPPLSSFLPSSTLLRSSGLSTTSLTTTTLMRSTSTTVAAIMSPVTGSLPTTPSEPPVSVVAGSSSIPATLVAPLSDNPAGKGKTFTRKVSLGPLNLTLTVTEAQRTTVVAAAIVQITAVATISSTGVSTGGSTRRRR